MYQRSHAMQLLCFVHGEGQKREQKIQQRSLSSFIAIPVYELWSTLQVWNEIKLFHRLLALSSGPKNSANFETRTKIKKTEISWEIFPENPVKVDFPRSELFNQKFQGFREEGQMERKFLVGNFRKFQYNTQGHIF